MPDETVPAHITGLKRHFEDLRDGTHGGSASREDKEAHFGTAVQLLAPVARQVLTELNTLLLQGSGQITETGLLRGRANVASYSGGVGGPVGAHRGRERCGRF